MDLRIKGKFWAGNIYNQFESICQDVDDFMSKDTMKFVENQVQSVGVSVKRFYSNVVQDILPLSEDIVEPKALLEDGGQVDMWDHVNSVAGMRTTPTCINEEQLSENHGSIDTMRNSDALLPFELDHVTQFPKPPDANFPEEAETPLHLTEDGDGKDDADNSVEENMPRGSAPLAENEIFSGTSDEDNENSTLFMVSSAALSAHEAGLLTIEKERISCNSFSNDAEYLSNTSSSGLLFENKLTVVEDPSFDENTSLSAASVASADKVNEDNSMLMDSQPPSACNVVHGSFSKNGILGDSFSTKDVSSDESTSLSVASVASADKINEDNSVLMDSQPPSACNVVHGSFLKNGILGDSFSTKDVSSDENTSLSAASVASADKVNEDNSVLMDSQPPSACNVVHGYFLKNGILGDSFSTKDVLSDENTSLSAASVASADKVNEDNSVLMDSQPPSACDVVHRSFVKNGILGDSFSTKDESFDVSSSAQSPELSFSYFSCDDDEEEEETYVFSSKSSISPKSSNILESTSASFINKAENIDHSEAERNISTPSSRTAYETKAMCMLPAISILKSNDNNTSPSDGSDFVDGSFKSRHGEHYNDGQFAISPSEAENEHEFGLGISDLMETVDLSPDVKHDERTVPFNGYYARVASHHRRNFRYYKNLIQDAFTSRKRLSKEYEHLAFMFGDIDMESSQDFEPRSLPTFPHTYADAVRTQLSQEMYETEWELL
ncbi:uncharacterized protein LOC105165435 isoform X2 [Sesamum indicum]|uniref:Uncharacterized protein LOC105165435 isoform X2 n=1 Tax=Sesamum indicum TaxID=4182 RepID=A0A6I9TIC7_SESIN|nr:uncharacterized protein LOC105165435 isoform X2 [Sesamum indicum]